MILIKTGSFELSFQLRHEVVIFRASIRQGLKYEEDVKFKYPTNG